MPELCHASPSGWYHSIMKFIADVMLGKLAKRLRLIGFDVLYDRTLDDNEIIRLSLAQNRVILTRDIALAGRPLASNRLLIESSDILDQIGEVVSAFPLERLPAFFSRCSVCNEPLAAVSREEVRDSVPAYVHETHDSFFRCGVCGRVYWRGTHVRRMRLAGR